MSASECRELAVQRDEWAASDYGFYQHAAERAWERDPAFRDEWAQRAVGWLDSALFWWGQAAFWNQRAGAMEP